MNVALVGSESASIAPVSATARVTVRASSVFPVRVSLNTASEPSATEPDSAVIVTSDTSSELGLSPGSSLRIVMLSVSVSTNVVTPPCSKRIRAAPDGLLSVMWNLSPLSDTASLVIGT